MKTGLGARLLAAAILTVAGFALQARGAPWLGPDAAPVNAVARLVGGILGWLALAWVGICLVDIAVRRLSALGRPGAPPPRLVQDLARVVLLGGAVIAIVGLVFDQPVAGLLTTSGILVVVLGIALRNMIADVFAGIALNMEHPYRIGDWIEVAPGQVGRVEEINWRATRLITRDETSLVVPNGLIAGSHFINFSYPERHYRKTLRLPMDPAAPPQRVKLVLRTAALAAPGVLRDPAPIVQLEGVDEAGAVYLVRYWVADGADENRCRDAVVGAVLDGLQRAGMTAAFPRRAVSMLPRPRETATGSTAPAAPLASMLGRIDLFQAFEESDLRALADAAHRRRFTAGRALVSEGEPGRSLYLLTEGILDVRVDRDGGTVSVGRLMPGAVFGEFSLLTGAPRAASVVAETDGVAFEIDKDHLAPILRSRPEVAAQLADLMAARQRRTRERLEPAETVAAPQGGAPDRRDLLDRVRGFLGL
ncbi:putative mechanosensitive channel protein [Caenispirillum salinarum AK4]|uniref:Small-conductance mechanosensitive channel n=1 Tax=Caenispirillum salinarum AK4 TaxID=1238182 RepID=K9GMR7_9PROT|nr:mechanosensitive ion channel family protein [Caenispirillum salinarum]EKV26392.1 putative mechanosensitive channel protein [Caenispirillum salinarum AK4]